MFKCTFFCYVVVVIVKKLVFFSSKIFLSVFPTLINYILSHPFARAKMLSFNT